MCLFYSYVTALWTNPILLSKQGFIGVNTTLVTGLHYTLFTLLAICNLEYGH